MTHNESSPPTTNGRLYDAAMSRNRMYRALATDEHSYLWRVWHSHGEGCDEILSVRRVASSSGRALHFRPKSGFLILDGGVSASGVVGDDADRWLNLHEPGVVRAFIDVLTASEWPAADLAFAHLDGWAWFGSAYRQRASALSAPVTRRAAHTAP
jgi:hypothetical protein